MWAVLTATFFLAGTPVAVEAMPRGHVLAAGDLEGDGAGDLVGMQLKRPVFEGRAVRLADVKTPDLVVRQSEVNVIYRSNSLTLSIPGKAMQAGGLGDYITIRISGRRDLITARISGPGEAEVSR